MLRFAYSRTPDAGIRKFARLTGSSRNALGVQPPCYGATSVNANTPGDVPCGEPSVHTGGTCQAVDFGLFYRAMLAPLRSYLSRILGCRVEAQDVAQNAFLRVHSAMGSRRVDEPRLYLFTTARRLAIDELRRRKRRPVHSLDHQKLDTATSPRPSTEDVVMARQELERFGKMLEKLPPGCRVVFQLCKVENLSHHEISARLGIARSTVEKQLARAFRLLREAYDEADASLERQSVAAAGVLNERLAP